MGHKPYRCFLFMILLTGVLFTGCDEESNPVVSSDDVSNTNFTASETFSIQVNQTTETTLRVEGINGEVKATGKTGASVIVISGEKVVGSESLADAEEHLDDLEVSVSTQGDEIIVRTSQPSETHGRSYIVNYDISLPENMIVNVTALNGNVSIDSTSQQLTIELTNGQVIFNDVTSPSTVLLTNGQIDAEILASLSSDAINAEMTIVNGNIDLDIPQSASATFSATVTNGIITTSNLTMDNMHSTEHSLTGTLGAGEGSIQLQTINGNIHVTGY